MTVFSYTGRDSRKGRGSNEPQSMKAWDASWCCRGDISDTLDQRHGCALFSASLQNIAMPPYRQHVSGSSKNSSLPVKQGLDKDALRKRDYKIPIQ